MVRRTGQGMRGVDGGWLESVLMLGVSKKMFYGSISASHTSLSGVLWSNMATLDTLTSKLHPGSRTGRFAVRLGHWPAKAHPHRGENKVSVVRI